MARNTMLVGMASLLFATWAVAVDGDFDFSRDDVMSRIAAVKPSAPMGWETIPWARSMAEARKAALREHVPLFVFTYAGNFARGRC